MSRSIMVALVVAVLAGALAAPQMAGAADANKDVRVINTASEPVPVTGTVSIGNTENTPLSVDVTNSALPVTQSGTWNVGISGTPEVKAQQFGQWNVGTTPVIPTAGSFNFLVDYSGTSPTPRPPDVVSGPDPSGTRYAITSMTVAKMGGTTGGGAALFGLTSDSAGACIRTPGVSPTTPGPRAAVRGEDTVQLVFPQPFVIQPAAGSASCLMMLTTDPLVVAVVGYRF